LNSSILLYLYKNNVIETYSMGGNGGWSPTPVISIVLELNAGDVLHTTAIQSGSVTTVSGFITICEVR
jgi:hypothetical protein